MQLLVSLHDVTPFHAARLDAAEALLAEAGVTRVAYLVVPDFHRCAPVAHDERFKAWCARPRPFAVDWVLHGYHHAEDRPPTRGGWTGVADALKRALLTGGEGEFLALPTPEVRRRIHAGRASLALLGLTVNAFVAPAWLFNDALGPALTSAGLRFTEDHLRVYDVQGPRSRRSPVISWATRTRLRWIASLVVCPILARWWSRRDLIRIAIHPNDMDSAATVASIRWVLKTAMSSRVCAAYGSIFADAGTKIDTH